MSLHVLAAARLRGSVVAVVEPAEPHKKRRGPPSKGKGEPVHVRLQPDQLAALDAWIKRHPAPKPTRPDAIRRILAEHLGAVGHLRTRPDLRKPKS